MMTASCYVSGNDDDKSNNNKDKVCLFLKRWGLVDHVLDHVLDYMLNHMLDHMLNYMLDYIIVGFVIIAL